MRVEGIVTIFQEFYKGTSKVGPYLAGNVKAKEGEFDYWLPIFVQGAAYKALVDAPMGAEYTISGFLASNAKKDRDGKLTRTLQVKVNRAARCGRADNPLGDQGITDEDIFNF